MSASDPRSPNRNRRATPPETGSRGRAPRTVRPVRGDASTGPAASEVAGGVAAGSDGTLRDEIRRIQKYPNRRLYDRTTSSHLTHEGLYELVASGQRVQVVDSRSGEDLTTVVLAQVLIEHDPLKFSAIPPELLHLLIRANRGVLPSLQRSMIEAMSGAAAGWIAWQERMASLFAPGAQRSMDWMMNSLGATIPQPPAGDTATLRAEVAALRDELESLRDKTTDAGRSVAGTKPSGTRSAGTRPAGTKKTGHAPRRRTR